MGRADAGGIVRDYAIGGATASLFYTEPSRTYDVDVFVVLPRSSDSTLTPLEGVYAWAMSRGYSSESEHIFIHDVPVQFLPAHNALAEEAIATAVAHDYEGVSVRVIGPEHLIAMALQAGGGRRRERAWQLLESGKVNRQALKTLLARYAISAEIDDES